jgi:hypothetical protein
MEYYLHLGDAAVGAGKTCWIVLVMVVYPLLLLLLIDDRMLYIVNKAQQLLCSQFGKQVSAAG